MEWRLKKEKSQHTTTPIRNALRDTAHSQHVSSHMKKKLLTILTLLLVQSIFGQDIDMFFPKVDSSTMVKAQFEFESIAEKTSLAEKVDFYLDHIVLRDSNSIFYFTAFEDYNQLKEARRNIDLLYSKVDTSEINSNLHFLDLNEDSKLDCVYDRLDLSYDFQRIEIFLDIESESVRSLMIPGFIITNYSFDQKMNFETFAWACCDESFRHYRQVEIDNGLNMSETHYYIPRRLEQPEKSFNKQIFLSTNDKLIYQRTFDNEPMTYLGQKIILSDNESLLEINTKNEWTLVIGKFENKKLPDNDNRIVGWIKK